MKKGTQREELSTPLMEDGDWRTHLIGDPFVEEGSPEEMFIIVREPLTAEVERTLWDRVLTGRVGEWG